MKQFIVLFAAIACTAFGAPPKSAPQVQSDRGTVGFLHYNLLSGGDIQYPAEALKAKQQGSGFYLMQLRPDGTVESLTVKSSSGSAQLDEAVTRTLKSYRFKPKTKGPLLWLVGFLQPATIIIKVSRVDETTPRRGGKMPSSSSRE